MTIRAGRCTSWMTASRWESSCEITYLAGHWDLIGVAVCGLGFCGAGASDGARWCSKRIGETQEKTRGSRGLGSRDREGRGRLRGCHLLLEVAHWGFEERRRATQFKPFRKHWVPQK